MKIKPEDITWKSALFTAKGAVLWRPMPIEIAKAKGKRGKKRRKAWMRANPSRYVEL